MDSKSDIRGFLLLIVVCVLFYISSPTVQANFAQYPDLSIQCRAEWQRVESIFKWLAMTAPDDEVFSDSGAERLWQDAIKLSNLSKSCK